jgi:hypothetical protein
MVQFEIGGQGATVIGKACLWSGISSQRDGLALVDRLGDGGGCCRKGGLAAAECGYKQGGSRDRAEGHDFAFSSEKSGVSARMLIADMGVVKRFIG